MNKVILITVWNRAEKLRQLLDSISVAEGGGEYKVVIVKQDHFKDVDEVIFNAPIKIFKVLQTYCGERSGVQNITRNREVGYNYAFFDLNADIVTAFEDDVVIGYDLLRFGEEMINKYSCEKSFMGVNMFSAMPFSQKRKFKFGRFRFGICGQAMCMPRRTWERVVKVGLLNDHPNMGLDGLLEPFFKSGFVVMPYCSRFIDTGWGGAHAPLSSNDSYFKKLQMSWVGMDPFEIKDYELDQSLEFNWGMRCIFYRPLANPIYFILMVFERVRKRLNLNLRNRVMEILPK